MRVLDLFAGLEGWSAPWRDAGHEVCSVDFDENFPVDIHADVMDLTPADLPWHPDVILASPPCEGFTVMNIGKNWTRPNDIPPHAPKTPLAWRALGLVAATVDLITELQPAFWVMENPRGKLRKLRVVAPYERRTVTYCQLGETRMKPTDLWGGFPPSLVLPTPCKNGDTCHVSAPRGSRTPGSVQGQSGGPERARIPVMLSRLVMEACERDLGSAATVGPLTLFGEEAG
jgi:hypothetical protein